MNWQESQESKEFYSHYEEPSRTDLALGGLLLAFFAAFVGANLDTTPDMGAIVVRAIVGLILAAGALGCLVCALKRERGIDSSRMFLQPVKVQTREHHHPSRHSRLHA